MKRLLLLTVLGALVLAPRADAAVTCRSGHTEYRHGGVRIFSMVVDGDHRWYACGRSPRWLGSGDVRDVIATRDGAIGVAAGGRITYLRTRGRELSDVRVLASTGTGYVNRSLAFASGGRVLRWKVADGHTRRVPIAGEALTCTAGTTLVESSGVRVFEIFRGPKDVLAACARGATKPRALASPGVDDQPGWFVESVKRTGSRVVFIAGLWGIGVIDDAVGDVRLRQLSISDAVGEVAIGADGAVVFAGLVTDDGIGAQSVVARLTDTGREPLAIVRGSYVPGSLTVGDDGRVSWRYEDGRTQSVPLGGEITIDCAAGTTLLDRDGLRVFDVLPAGGDTSEMYGCGPGATVPVLLRSGKRTESWNVVELLRSGGRIALFSHSENGLYFPGVTTFSAAPGSAVMGIGEPSGGSRSIKGVAIAPDGRAALAVHDHGVWAILAYDASGLLTTPAARTDGFQAGSLAFDGSRISWRNGAGAARDAKAP